MSSASRARDPLISSAYCLQSLIYPPMRESTRIKFKRTVGQFYVCCQTTMQTCAEEYRRNSVHTTPVKGKEIIDNDNELADDDAHLADSDVFFDLMQKPVETERK